MLCANVKVSAEIYEKIMPNRPQVRDTVLPQARFFFWFQTYNYRKSPLGALKEGGKNSHRRGFASPPPSVREASYKSLAQRSCAFARALHLRDSARYTVAICALSRKTECRAAGEHWVFLNLTELSYRSTRKKDFAERFFAKRSGKRCKRGVRLRRTTRRVRFAAAMSVQKEIRELFTGRTRRR